MKREEREIGAFEAKTQLSRLLRETERGVSFRITRRGKVVARLIAVADTEDELDCERILERFREIRQRVKGSVNVRELIEEGRRF
jgi:prevent-host-death family protein